MRNDLYWLERFKILDDALLDQGLDFVTNLDRQYDMAIVDLEKEIAVWYQRFANNNSISMADAKKLLTSSQLKELKWSVEEYIKVGKANAINGAWLQELENASAKVHITRLESLQLHLQQQAEFLHASLENGLTATLTDLYQEGYYRTAYEIQKGVGVAWSLQELPSTVIAQVLAQPWTIDDRTFRDRCWTNRKQLVASVNQLVTQMIMRGAAPDKAIAAIAKEFGVDKRKAGRLVMTESAAFSNNARGDCYRDLDVEQYQLVETLDGKTCVICGDLDGRVYDMTDYIVGTTVPPFHPWCRGSTAPYFADLEGYGRRFARGEDGKTYRVSKDTTYKQWKEKAFTNDAQDDIIDDIIEDLTPTSPQGCKSFAELDTYFADTYNIKIAPEVKDLDFESVRASLEGVDLVVKEFPGGRSHLTGIGTSSSGVMCAGFDGSINFNPAYYRDSKNLSGMIQGSAKGFHPKNTGILETGSHEMGHILERALIDTEAVATTRNAQITEWTKCTRAKAIVSQACRNAKKTAAGKGMLNDQLRASISGYAETNDSECLAEAVGDYIANKENSSPLSVEIWKLLKEKLGKG